MSSNVKNNHGTQLCGPQVCVPRSFLYICVQNQKVMNKAFVYGMSVEGENFTDRVKETKRLAQRICETVENHSSYVQQLAWNVLVETDKETTEQDFENGVQALLAQCSGLFEQHIQGLTAYQMNFIRAICNGVHTDFGSKTILEEYNLA